jgi:hypothetical protein
MSSATCLPDVEIDEVAGRLDGVQRLTKTGGQFWVNFKVKSQVSIPVDAEVRLTFDTSKATLADMIMPPTDYTSRIGDDPVTQTDYVGRQTIQPGDSSHRVGPFIYVGRLPATTVKVRFGGFRRVGSLASPLRLSGLKRRSGAEFVQSGDRRSRAAKQQRQVGVRAGRPEVLHLLDRPALARDDLDHHRSGGGADLAYGPRDPPKASTPEFLVTTSGHRWPQRGRSAAPTQESILKVARVRPETQMSTRPEPGR